MCPADKYDGHVQYDMFSAKKKKKKKKKRKNPVAELEDWTEKRKLDKILKKTGQALGSTTCNVRPRIPSLNWDNNDLIGTNRRG